MRVYSNRKCDEMKFKTELLEGRLIRRYKRFLADVELISGEKITAHTANTGKMLGCSEPGSRVWLSKSSNLKRKYPHTWELVEVNNKNKLVLVGINTQMSNELVNELIATNCPPELTNYENIRREVPYGEQKSRIDILLEGGKSTNTSSLGQSGDKCYIEVKNVTLVEGAIGYFPDAITARGVKHLNELAYVVASGQRAVMFYCVQRDDVEEVRPADFIDSLYAERLRKVSAQGVEVMAYKANVSCDTVTLIQQIPVVI